MPTFALYSRATAGPQPILDSVIAFLLENRCGVVLHKNICCESLDFQSTCIFGLNFNITS